VNKKWTHSQEIFPEHGNIFFVDRREGWRGVTWILHRMREDSIHDTEEDVICRTVWRSGKRKESGRTFVGIGEEDVRCHVRAE
jgi:hypothetical protein